MDIDHSVTMMLTAGWGSTAALNILGGRNCSASDIETCRTRYAAELVVDGKVIGSIPLDLIPEDERRKMVSALRIAPPAMFLSRIKTWPQRDGVCYAEDMPR